MTWLAHNTSSDSDGIGRPFRVHGLKRKAFLDLILLGAKSYPLSVGERRCMD
jgi:hypothetical protein